MAACLEKKEGNGKKMDFIQNGIYIGWWMEKKTEIRNGQCYNGKVPWKTPHFCVFNFYLNIFLLATFILRGNYHQYFALAQTGWKKSIKIFWERMVISSEEEKSIQWHHFGTDPLTNISLDGALFFLKYICFQNWNTLYIHFLILSNIFSLKN